MGLNKSKGNMYSFITDTWNGIKGKCVHNCKYCFMPQERLNPCRLDESEFKTDMGRDKFIFVGTSIDMWAYNIPEAWILAVLDHCKKYPDNRYLFQTKNPYRFHEFISQLPKNSVLCVTIESDIDYKEISNAPLIIERVRNMEYLPVLIEKMITIEPIMKFNLDPLMQIIKRIDPIWVNIGANSKNKIKLPEPGPQEILKLVEGIKENRIVKKSNLARLLNPWK